MKQNLGTCTSQGFFSKLSTSTLMLFMWGPPTQAVMFKIQSKAFQNLQQTYSLCSYVIISRFANINSLHYNKQSLCFWNEVYHDGSPKSCLWKSGVYTVNLQCTQDTLQCSLHDVPGCARNQGKLIYGIMVKCELPARNNLKVRYREK